MNKPLEAIDPTHRVSYPPPSRIDEEVWQDTDETLRRWTGKSPAELSRERRETNCHQTATRPACATC